MSETKQTRPPGPAGDPIPLAQARPGGEFILLRVEGTRHCRHRLAEMGLIPGMRFTVVSGGKGPCIISLLHHRLMLGKAVVRQVMVCPA